MGPVVVSALQQLGGDGAVTPDGGVDKPSRARGAMGQVLLISALEPLVAPSPSTAWVGTLSTPSKGPRSTSNWLPQMWGIGLCC